MTLTTQLQAQAYQAPTPYFDIYQFQGTLKDNQQTLVDQWMGMMDLNESASVLDILKAELTMLDEKGIDDIAQANAAIIIDHLEKFQAQYGTALLYSLDDIYSYIYQIGNARLITVDDLSNLHPLTWQEFISAVNYLGIME